MAQNSRMYDPFHLTLPTLPIHIADNTIAQTYRIQSKEYHGRNCEPYYINTYFPLSSLNHELHNNN